MAIDPEKQKQIALLGEVAPNLAKLAGEFAQRKGESDALDSAGNKFTELASKLSNVIRVKQIDLQLKDPQTMAQVRDVLNRNPKGFEQVLPQIFADPSKTASLIQQQLAAAPAPARASTPVSASPSASPPVEQSRQQSQPAPTPVAASAAAGQKPAQPAPAAAKPSAAENSPGPQPAATPKANGAAPARAPVESGGLAGFISFLDSQKEKNPQIAQDFETFLKKIESDQIPEVSQAFHALTKGQENDPQSKAALNELKKTVESQPQFFANINKAMDKNPGVMTGIAKDAMAFGGGPAAVLKGVAGYSQFSESSFAQSGFGKMILQFIDGFFGKGGLAGMINGLLGKVGIDFRLGTDGKDLQAQSNNNGAMTRDALKQQGSNPASVTVQDSSGSKQTKTGAQFASEAPAAPERSPQEQRALQEALGVRPGV